MPQARVKRLRSRTEACDDRLVMKHPGLVKASPRLVEGRDLRRIHDDALAHLLATADVVSEGKVHEDQGGRAWFGSTSMILRVTTDLERVVALISRDLHARTRVLRVARREASLRAPCPLGPLRSEVRVTSAGGSLRIDVDVQAPLIEGRSRGRRIV